MDSNMITRPRLAGIVLVGPPAAGKSTIRNLLGDMGVATADVSDAPKSEWRDDCWDLLGRTTPDVPVCAIEGLRTDEEVEWFTAKFGQDALVVRVDTHSVNERLDRYLERELDTTKDVVTVDELRDLHDEVARQEDTEIPDHHISLYNDDDVSITELATRLRGLVNAVSPTPIDDDLLGIE